MSYPKNSASPPPIHAVIVDISQDPPAPIEAEVEVYVSKDGGVPAEGEGTLTHLGEGEWAYTPTQAETNATTFSVRFLHEDAFGKGPLVQVLTDKRVDALQDYDGSDTPGTTTLLSRLTDTRSGYLDKLNVSGTLAHSDAANTYKADVSGVPEAVWSAEARSLTDKTGYSLTSDYDAAKSAAKAGDAMALTAGERTTLAAALEAAMINDVDGQALMEAIANLVANEIEGSGLAVETIAAAARDAILNRELSGNHDSAGTVGKLIQYLDAAISSRLASTSYSAPDNSGIAAAKSAAESANDKLPSETSTLLARLDEAVSTRSTPADIPTVEEIDAELTDSHGSGSWRTGEGGGSGGGPSETTILVPIRIADEEDNPEDDVLVEIATDEAKANVVWAGRTTASGYVYPNLDSGEYWAWASKSGRSYPNPIHFVVSEEEED